MLNNDVSQVVYDKVISAGNRLIYGIDLVGSLRYSVSFIPNSFIYLLLYPCHQDLCATM